MPLTTVFHASLYGTICLAGFILGRAEGNFIPYLTILVAMVGYMLTEHYKKWMVTVPVANALGLVAFLVAAIEFTVGDREGKLLAGAHLVVYLNWIVLLQKKTNRQYWAMAALSLLQVAVASVLTNDSWYGGMLVLYSVVAMWSLAIFSLHQANQQFESGRREPVARTPLAGSSLSITTASVIMPSETWSTIRHDGSARWVTPRFILGVMTIASMSLMLSGVFFTLVPRVWIGPRLSLGDEADGPVGSLGRNTMTGFTSQVKLGSLGEILENSTPVLQVRLFDSETDREIDVNQYCERLGYAEPLFRGIVLSRYESSQWLADVVFSSQDPLPRILAEPAVRQEYVLEPVGTDLLFVIGDVRACDLDGSERRRVVKHTTTSVLTRDSVGRSGSAERIGYTAYSAPMPAVVQPFAIMPVSSRLWQEYLSRNYLEDLLILNDDVAAIRPIVERILEEKTRQVGSKLTPVQQAVALESWLRDSGNFKYTLKQARVDLTVDPVIDFLINRKEGHCEYFNTALALMLRAAGIPSRLVSGFKGGDTNPLNGRFEVQQRHAHVWVEAFLTEPNGKFFWGTFDATPVAERNTELETIGGKMTFWQAMSSEISMFWSRYVVNVTLNDQEQGVYGPLRDWVASLGGQLKDRTGGIQSLLYGLFSILASPKEWLTVGGMLRLLIILVLFTGLLYVLKYGIKLSLKGFSKYSQKRKVERKVVEFYERFQKVIAQAGLKRDEAQTQREFALQVTHKLSQRLHDESVLKLPEELTELFYKVRFGDDVVDAATAQSLDDRLDRLESLLDTNRQRHHASKV
ncbi:transglutaminase TgpA family protein [Planctopirus hydrillae]|nr:DUF3488 and transglutaminase-like domain-containing protein [Planctopirus hydrillae]